MDPVCVAIPQVEKFPEYQVPKVPSPNGSPALGPRRYTPSNLNILDNRSQNPYRVRSPEDEHKALIKNVKGILNKITPEKYDQLSQSLCEIDFDATNQEVVCVVIGCVFEAAVKQSIFCGLFADLCKDLMAYHQRKNMKEGQEKAAKASFRRALLNRCQEEFERPQPVPTDVPPEDRKALEVRFKQRQLGNIKFIAELFRRKMLVEKIMHEVIKRLLLGMERSPDYIPTDEDIEVLHKLLYTAGKLLDRPEAASYMERYFTRIKELSKTHPRSRMRFMLQDLIELRTNAWVQRREEEKAQTFAELESAFATKSRDKVESLSKTNSFNSITPTSNNEKDRRAPFRQIQTTCTTSQYCNPDIYTSSMIGTPTQIQSKPTWIVLPQGPVQQCWESCQTSVVNTIPPANKSPLVRPVPCTAPFEIQLSNRLAALAQETYNQEIIPTCITDNSNKEMNDMELEKAAMQILSEFQTSQQLEDLLYSLSLLGHQNHPGFINKAIQISVSSLVRHSSTRVLLTEMLRILINVELNDSRNLTQDSIYSGFRQFLSDTIENSMSEDNPRIWESFAELLVMCVQAFPFPCLQYVVPPSFVNSEYAGVLVLCILNKIAEISYRERANPMASANLIRLLFGEYVTTTYLEHLRCQLSGPTTYAEGTLGACKLLATQPY